MCCFVPIPSETPMTAGPYSETEIWFLWSAKMKPMTGPEAGAAANVARHRGLATCMHVVIESQFDNSKYSIAPRAASWSRGSRYDA